MFFNKFNCGCNNCCNNCCDNCGCDKEKEIICVTGATGATGPAGATGATGPAGIQGRMGATGATGATGIQGVMGVTGATGPTGANGITPVVTVAGTITGEPGTNASVTETFETAGSKLLFTIPRGMTGPTGAQGSKGEKGEQGERGPVASMIPFAISKHGSSLATDENGRPSVISFSGFGPSYYSDIFLEEGEFDSGKFTVKDDTTPPPSFVITAECTLKKIYAYYHTYTSYRFPDGTTIKPFVCLAVSDGTGLTFNILQDSFVYTEVYNGGVEYPSHAMKRGNRTDLNIKLKEGQLVAIVAGIMADNIPQEEGTMYSLSGMFNVSGGLYLE